MPLIRVELFDFRVNDETSAKLIAGLTDALCAATAERASRAHVGHRRGSQPEELGCRREAVAGRPDAACVTPARCKASLQRTAGSASMARHETTHADPARRARRNGRARRKRRCRQPDRHEPPADEDIPAPSYDPPRRLHSARFAAVANRYYANAKAAGFDYTRLWRTPRPPSARTSRR